MSGVTELYKMFKEEGFNIISYDYDASEKTSSIGFRDIDNRRKRFIDISNELIEDGEYSLIRNKLKAFKKS